MITTSDVPERELIDRLKCGDHEAFECLYRQHKKRVYNLCLRMTNNHPIAEELTQEVFLTVFRRIESFRGESRFTTWLHRIAVNAVLMHVRERGARISEVAFEELEGPSEEHHSPRDRYGCEDSMLGASLDRVTLERALTELPPGYRIVIVLHDIEGYEHGEIAQLLGCSVGNTKSQLHKARLKLRRILTRRVAIAAGQSRRAAQPHYHLAA